MGTKKLYWCDTCEDKDVPYDDLVGVTFKTAFNFELSDPGTTDGTHICRRCLYSMWEQAPKFIEARRR